MNPKNIHPNESVCSIAVKTASDINSTLIVVITDTGLTARLVGKYRPRQKILALW